MSMNKYVLLIVFAVLFNLKANSQNEFLSYDELKSVVLELNSRMPMHTGFSMQINSIDIDREKLTYFVNINSLVKNIQNVSQDVLKNNAIITLSSMSEDSEIFLRTLISLNMGIRYVYTVSQMDTMELYFSSDELCRILENKYTPEDKVNILISGIHLTIPMDIGQGITMVDMCKRNGYIDYVFEIDETIIDINDLIKMQDISRQYIIQGLSTDMVSLQQAAIFYNAGYGMKYLYVGKTTKTTFALQITTKELYDILSNAGMISDDGNDGQDNILDSDSVAVPDYNYLGVDSMCILDDSCDLDSIVMMNREIETEFINFVMHSLMEDRMLCSLNEFLYEYCLFRRDEF